MTTKRKVYSEEIKRAAVGDSRSGMLYKDVLKKYGISSSMLLRWRKIYPDEGGAESDDASAQKKKPPKTTTTNLPVPVSPKKVGSGLRPQYSDDQKARALYLLSQGKKGREVVDALGLRSDSIIYAWKQLPNQKALVARGKALTANHNGVAVNNSETVGSSADAHAVNGERVLISAAMRAVSYLKEARRQREADIVAGDIDGNPFDDAFCLSSLALNGLNRALGKK